MARKAFYSFYYDQDNWRVAKVRNMGVVEGDQVVSDNRWEQIRAGGDAAIERWINDQMKDKSVVVVLIGTKTAGRKFVDYEIEKGWNDRKGVLGIHIHNLKDREGNQSGKGSNPFSKFTVNGTKLSSIVKTYDPPRSTSRGVYSYIEDNLANWIEEAIRIRNRN